MSATPTFIMTAGEASGDAHAALLIRQLRQYYPQARFIGIGGERMLAEGFHSIVPLSTMNVVGFWEVAKRYRYLSSVLQQCKELFAKEKPIAFIPVDYPGFNIRLAKTAKQQGIPVLYYIAPQLWAWGKKRADSLREAVDLLMVVFPFEEDFFGSMNIPTRFVGHPLLDRAEFANPTPIEERSPLVALLPGSRKQEVLRHAPILAQTMKLLHRQEPSLRFGVARSALVADELYARTFTADIPCTLYQGSAELLAQSRFTLVKAGTSTLEAALFGTPMAVYYKTSLASYLLAKRLVNLPYISLVNILSNKEIVPEFIQQNATPEMLSAYVLRTLHSAEAMQEQLRSFDLLRELLGGSGASATAAESIKNYLTKR